jgi:hypothetical protein
MDVLLAIPAAMGGRAAGVLVCSRPKANGETAADVDSTPALRGTYLVTAGVEPSCCCPLSSEGRVAGILCPAGDEDDGSKGGSALTAGCMPLVTGSWLSGRSHSVSEQRLAAAVLDPDGSTTAAGVAENVAEQAAEWPLAAIAANGAWAVAMAGKADNSAEGETTSVDEVQLAGWLP